VTQENNAQNRTEFMRTADLLRQARPEITAVRLDEMKRDVLSRDKSVRPRIGLQPLRSRALAFSLFVLLFAMSSSNAAATVLNFISGGTLGSSLGKNGFGYSTSYFFGSYHFGGDKSDDAGHETYCPDDKGSDDNDASSGDNSDGDKYSDDKDGSSGDQSDDGGHHSYASSTSSTSGSTYHSTTMNTHPQPGDECDDTSDGHSDGSTSEKSDDNDASSGDHSDEKSDDNDASSGDKSDGDQKSDDNDASSGDHSDEKSDDNDASSGDHSD
jgi:hypothetical protein